ncbi:MAG: glutamine amidotransferase [Solirubrobacteraceae bacterium]
MTETANHRPRVLVVGESWIKHTVHMKGFDQFHTTEYEEGGGAFLDSLSASGIGVTYIRAHEVSGRFPTTIAELDEYDVVVLSDIGANSFLLTDDVFLRSEASVNRLSLLCDYVRRGGGLVMIGGYMSFSGIDGRARFGMSPLADVLPVSMLHHDDRVEVPEGLTAQIDAPEHEVLGGTPSDWPILLGYNRLIAKPQSTVVVSFGGDPLLVVADVGAGRTVAFAPDFAPHWAPPEFVAWDHYPRLWTSIIRWAAGAVGREAGLPRSVTEARL